jgi:hypothetical protein
VTTNPTGHIYPYNSRHGFAYPSQPSISYSILLDCEAFVACYRRLFPSRNRERQGARSNLCRSPLWAIGEVSQLCCILCYAAHSAHSAARRRPAKASWCGFFASYTLGEAQYVVRRVHINTCMHCKTSLANIVLQIGGHGALYCTLAHTNRT